MNRGFFMKSRSITKMAKLWLAAILALALRTPVAMLENARSRGGDPEK
jgi:hypothetical protein